MKLSCVLTNCCQLLVRKCQLLVLSHHYLLFRSCRLTMPSSKKKSKEGSKKGKKDKKTKIDEYQPDEVKEKIYTVKELETSSKLLECDEDDVVLDALLFLTKYGDIQINNLNFLQQRGILSLILKLLDRNICLQRLSLRMIDQILRKTDFGIYEIDQEMYDEDVLKICNMYCTTEDFNIKEFSLRVLERLATTNRSPVLIFKTDLLKPIYDTLENSTNLQSIEYSLRLFKYLINTPSVMVALAEKDNFNAPLLIEQMKIFEPVITELAMDIIEKITIASIDELQKRWKEAKIVEEMIEIIIDETKAEYRHSALEVIKNCVNNDETSTYFTTSKQFLHFSLWIRTCSSEYILACAEIFEKLSEFPSIRQLMLDLSIVDSILYLLRSYDKKVLNLTCTAICNLSTHKYCCERIITPVVIQTILEILKRNDKIEDPNNEIALRTIHELTVRNMRMSELLMEFDCSRLMMTYLEKGLEELSVDSYKRVLELINLFINTYQSEDILNSHFYLTILDHFRKYHDEDAVVKVLELMMYCLKEHDFRSVLLINNIPDFIVRRLEENISERLLKYILAFTFNSLFYKKITLAFIEARLLLVLKNESEYLKIRIPLITRVINATYDICLPLKFFDTNKLEVTDKIRDCFYIMTGFWRGGFPFLEILEMQKVSTLNTIYVVRHVRDPDKESFGSIKSDDADGISHPSLLSDPSMSESSRKISFNSASIESQVKNPIIINYGRLSQDPYLFIYISIVSEALRKTERMEDRIQTVARFVDQQLCGPYEDVSMGKKIHAQKLHIESLKTKLGTNMIPIGFLRIGFHCEKALLFKVIADKVLIPCTLQKGENHIYWNEVTLIAEEDKAKYKGKVRYFVVDLMKRVGELMLKGSREANEYCRMKY